MDAGGQPRSSKSAPEVLVPFLGLIVAAAAIVLAIASAGAADFAKTEWGSFAMPKDPDADDIWINEDAP